MMTTTKAKISCSPPIAGRTDWLKMAHIRPPIPASAEPAAKTPVK